VQRIRLAMSQGGHICGCYLIAGAASVSNLEPNKLLKQIRR
jgi:hypothetical protein